VELGWRIGLADNHVRLNGGLFGLHWEAVQSDIVGVDGLVRTINAGSADNYGLELGVSADWRGMFMEGSFTGQHARLTRPAAAANAIGDDNRLPVLPDFAGSMKIGFDRHMGRIDGQIFGTVRYMGPARLSFDPGLARSMGDYWVVGVGATAHSGPWTLSAAVTNLLDGRGDSFGFGNPFTVRTVDQRTPVQPRTATLRIEYRF
jgi:outer membrane receptor protein involved in Fe transport